MRSYFIAALYFVLLFVGSREVAAHPLGNFSISQYSAFRIIGNEIDLRYIIDMAEIPTFQEIQESGIIPKAGDPNLEAYLMRKTELLRDGLTLEVNGKLIRLRIESKEIIFPPGAGDLPTMKIGVLYKAKLTGESKNHEYLLSYRDGNFPGRAGWKEIVAVAAPGAGILDSSVPEVDRSSQLNNYPTDLLDSQPQVLEAKVTFTTAQLPAPVASSERIEARGRSLEKPTTVSKFQMTRTDVAQRSSNMEPEKQQNNTPILDSGVIDLDSPRTNESNTVQLQANRQATPRNSFTELMAAKQWGWGVVLMAIAVAVGLGGVHALEPGHGKTLVAAYLVGSQGTMKHAFFLGLIVTATHTAGVYLLGAVTLYAAQYVMPEQLYPWLGVLSGLLITGLGLVLFARRYFGDADLISHHHHHHHGDRAHAAHDHHHGDDLHHQHAHPHHGIKRDVSLRELMALGISGGIVPCPAALVVLLSAVSMQRITLGLLLILGFSVGLATVLIVTGLMMVYARRFMARFHGTGRVTTRWLPLTSSAFIVVFGVALTWQALRSAGLLQIGL